MKSTTTKLVLELKEELRLICCTKIDIGDVDNIFLCTHAGDMVNPETDEKYNAEKDREAPI